MRVLKFGGSSLGTPARIRDVARIVLEHRQREPIIVVVSAFQGVTNQLVKCARLAALGDEGYQQILKELGKRHRSAAARLAGRRSRPLRSTVELLLAELRDTLHGIYLLRHCPARALDMAMSFGERLSAEIIGAHLNQRRPAVVVDARKIIVTDDQFTRAAVNFPRTNRTIKAYFSRLFRRQPRAIPVMTGFIAATEDGRTTTIGRNGSDYSAAIVGAAVGASTIEIWTDVDGVLSADPKFVSSAFALPHTSYEEAMELSYFGSKVLHSATIAPAAANTITIPIKNPFHPSAP